MFSPRLSMLLVATLLIVSAVAPKPGRKGRKSGKIDSDDFKDLQDEVESMETRLAALEKHAEEHHEHEGDGTSVHMYFHGDGQPHAGHSDADMVHVHVDLDDGHHGGHGMDHVHEAHCEFHSVDPSSGIEGHVHLIEQPSEHHARIHVHFEHLDDDDDEYELHVHNNGDSSKGCESFGTHFTPSSGVSATIGTVSADADGMVHAWFNDTQLQIAGHDGVIGRGIVIHDEDDAPVACCVVGYSHEMDQAGHHGHHGNHGNMPQVELFGKAVKPAKKPEIGHFGHGHNH